MNRKRNTRYDDDNISFAFGYKSSITTQREARSHGAVFRSRLFPDQRLVDMWDDATAGDRSLDQAVQLFVSSNGELKMPWRDSFHFEILRRIPG